MRSLFPLCCVCLLAVACTFDPPEFADDGARAGEGLRCDLLTALEDGALSDPEPLPFNTIAREFDPYLTPDGLTLYFASNRPGSQETDLWLARRSNSNAPFADPIKADALGFNTPELELRLWMTDDQRTAVLARRPRGGDGDLYIATRSSAALPFGDLEPLAELNTGDEFDPWLSSDGLRIYYAGEQPGRSTRNVLMARRENAVTGDAPFGDARPVIATGNQSMGDIYLTADELLIFYTVGADLRYATRSRAEEAFSVGASVPVIDGSDITVSSDGCEIFFQSDAAGSQDLYVSRVLTPGF